MKTINTENKENKNSKKKMKKQQPKKKEKKMYANGLYGAVASNKVIPPEDLLSPDEAVNISLSDSKKNRGYIFVDHKNIQEIYEKSGPLAKSNNEFQVHYWFLNFRYTADDGSHIDIAVPTCYFNYEQFVTTGHIDFELTDVIPMSEALEPVHNMKVNQIIKTNLHQTINKIFGVEFEPMSVNFGTLHRHPGHSTHQSFSTTDLNVSVKTKKDSLGVVFPLATAEDDKPSFSMIIAIDGQNSHYYNPSTGIANLAHAEYRIANGDIKTGLHYEKNRCIAFNVKQNLKPSVVERMFGAKEISNTVVKFDNTESVLVELEQELARTFEALYSGIYTASTDVVLETNVKQRQNIVKSVVSTGVYKNPYYYSEEDINNMYDDFNNATELNTDTKQESDAKKDNSHLYTKNMKVSEKDFNDAVSKLNNYEQNEKIKSLLDSFEKKELVYKMDLESLKKCVEDYNIATKAYYGTKENQLELLETYVIEVDGSFTFDEGDITDFMNEIYLMLENIIIEKEEFRKIISMYKMLNPSSKNKETEKEVISENVETNNQESKPLQELVQEPENKSIFKKATEAVGTLFHKEETPQG